MIVIIVTGILVTLSLVIKILKNKNTRSSSFDNYISEDVDLDNRPGEIRAKKTFEGKLTESGNEQIQKKPTDDSLEQ